MNNKELMSQLIDKSVEAFILGLEIYNKPTIKYRIEGFSFFICNAWELMLKAELIKRNISIYFPENTDRTLSLSETIKKIYSDKNTRIRLNLEKIIDLRNISTHYITRDYEIKYAPLFQACVLNFMEEILRFHDEDITKHISQDFLTITTSYEPLTNQQIILRYPPEIAEKFIKQGNEIEMLSQEYNSDKFSINIKQNLYITKKKDEADFLIKIDKNSDLTGTIIKDRKDPADTHKYSFSTIITAVEERMKKQRLKIDNKNGFTSHVLNLFINFYDIKYEEKYCYGHRIGKSLYNTYSQELIDFIMSEINKNPCKFVESLKNK